MKSKTRMFLMPVLMTALTLACAINNITISEKPNLELTITAQALAIQQTGTANALSQQNSQAPAPAVVAPADTLAAPTSTNTPEPTVTTTAQQPQMINSTLCWVGPGPKYEVMSALSKAQVVEVIGRGNADGWIIIKNPIYNDPCWVQSFDIQLGPSIDVPSLKIFSPPPPTKTPVPPTPTLVP